MKKMINAIAMFDTIQFTFELNKEAEREGKTELAHELEKLYNLMIIRYVEALEDAIEIK